MHVIAAKAVALKEALQPSFRTYQEQVVVNARALAAALVERGYRIVSGGTDNHLMLVDLRPKGATGKEAVEWLDRARITVNKNLIPYDPQPALVTSGIRLGTPAATTRGLREPQMRLIAQWIDEVITARGDERTAQAVRARVEELAEQFPLYPELRPVPAR
jgi:glycine hydroxymethyltransferase